MNNVSNSTTSVKQIIRPLPIANSQPDKTSKPIANSLLVDIMLNDYSDLIDTNYRLWFAKRFYTLQFDRVHRAASEARADGKDPKRLFAFLIRKLA